MASVRTHLWFGNNKAVEAANFYAEHIPNSVVNRVFTARTEPDNPVAEVVEFTVAGPRGDRPQRRDRSLHLDEAFSFYLRVDGQDEVDRYWELLTADGGEPGPCGWCKDKFGVSWQVIPARARGAVRRLHHRGQPARVPGDAAWARSTWPGSRLPTTAPDSHLAPSPPETAGRVSDRLWQHRAVRHRYECPMRWADMDLLGHVNNVTYVDYLQEARVDLLRHHGPTAHRRRGAGRGGGGGAARGAVRRPADVRSGDGQHRGLGDRDPGGVVHDGLRGLPRDRRRATGLPRASTRADAVRLRHRAAAAAHAPRRRRRWSRYLEAGEPVRGRAGRSRCARSSATTRSTSGSPTSTSTATSTT